MFVFLGKQVLIVIEVIRIGHGKVSIRASKDGPETESWSDFEC
jgi:hypothetical protein